MLAVWDSRHTVHYYDRSDATPKGEHHFDLRLSSTDLSDAFWNDFSDSLKTPGGCYLSPVYMAGLSLYQSLDGRLRLYHFQDGSLVLEIEGRHVPLHREQDGRFLIAALDRALGLCAAFSDSGQLHIFQQHVRVGVYDIGLNDGVEARLNLAMPDGLGKLLISDGERVLIIDAAGRIVHELHSHYAVGAAAISPNGEVIALSDMDDNVIRIYDGALRPTHQKYAIDLIATARQVQLVASMPGRKAGIAALDVSNNGLVAFALGGVVCVTDLTMFSALPQPRVLL